jgi:Zn-dependent peptidase ImmA (M78 family)
VKLPFNTTALTTPNDDNTWTVALNIDLSEAKQRTALLHELGHILNNDFYVSESVDTIELKNNACNHAFVLDDHVITYII